MRFTRSVGRILSIQTSYRHVVEEAFFHLLITAIVNAHIVYKKVTKKKISLDAFIIKIGSQLVEKTGLALQSDHNTMAVSSGRLLD